MSIDFGTAVAVVVSLVGGWWGTAKIMFSQFEKRQDERFQILTNALSAQKDELTQHMRKQDDLMLEIRRIESLTASEIRRIESDIARNQLEAHQRFQTKQEAISQHSEIMDALRELSIKLGVTTVKH